MKELGALIRRNVSLFFKDKGMFFTSLITPVILLVLYATFLANVYRDIFESALPAQFSVPDSLINGCVGGQLVSSILAVSCVTVAFCSNMLSVQDKVNGTLRDLTVSPVRSSVLSLSYYIASFLSTLIICFTALGLCLLYLAKQGWYLSTFDVVCLFGDVFLLVMFGTALSSIINIFLKTQGQISAVGTVISAGYGFVCGAYMPISQFSVGLQRVLSFLPGTYGTSLLRNHALRGVYDEMIRIGFPSEVVEGIKDSIDCNLYFFDRQVELPVMVGILVVAVIVLLLIDIILTGIRSRKAEK